MNFRGGAHASEPYGRWKRSAWKRERLRGAAGGGAKGGGTLISKIAREARGCVNLVAGKGALRMRSEFESSLFFNKVYLLKTTPL